MHRSNGSIKIMSGAISRDTAWTGRRRSLADVDCHNEVRSTAVFMNQCASESPLTCATIDNGYQFFT